MKERQKSSEEFFRQHPISVDNDGVISDTRGYVISKVNKELGSDYLIDDIDDWHWVKNTLIDHGWDEESAKKFNNTLWFDPDSLYEVSPVEGAFEFLEWFQDRGLEYHVITSRDPHLRASTIAWYQKHFPFVDKNKIILSPTKERRGDFFKVWAIKYLVKPAIHIEDSSDHAKLILEYTDTTVGFMSNSTSLDYLKSPRLIKLLDSSSYPTMHGVKDKIINDPLFDNVAQY